MSPRLACLAPLLLLQLVPLVLPVVPAGAGSQPAECEPRLAQLASLCRCQPAESAESAEPAEPAEPAESSEVARLSQLECRLTSPGQLASLLAPKQAWHIDRMALSLHLDQQRPQNWTPISAISDNAIGHQFRVQHLSVELSLASLLTSQLERQLTQLLRLLQRDQLKSLALLLHQQTDEQPQAGPRKALQGLRLAQLLPASHFLSLERLQVSLSPQLELWLEPGHLGSLKRLRALELASNGAIRSAECQANGFACSLFLPARNLEHLSLEANNLDRFALFEQLASQPTGNKSGHSQLSSLSLASNRLSSFPRHLQLGTEPHRTTCQAYWPRMARLDLSHNRLAWLPASAGRALLCSMPNLSELYLQHNRLAQLNLNTLLSAPPPSGLHAQQPISRLEHIDLSHNWMLLLMASNHLWTAKWHSVSRLKSLNVAHNQLRRPLLSLDANMVDIVAELGAQSWPDEHENGNNHHYQQASLDLAHFDAQFMLANSQTMPIGRSNASSPATMASLCDLLASSGGSGDEDLFNEVILSHNQLLAVSSTHFASPQCRQIQSLSLSRNLLASIHALALNELLNLEHLDLSHNLLVNLDDRLFSKNSRLRDLNLAHNQLERIGESLFAALSNLEQLLLRNNRLSELPTHLFRHTLLLNRLDLSENNIHHLPDGLFLHLSQLQVLQLNDNQLNHITRHPFSPAQLAQSKSAQATQKSPTSDNAAQVPHALEVSGTGSGSKQTSGIRKWAGKAGGASDHQRDSSILHNNKWPVSNHAGPPNWPPRRRQARMIVRGLPQEGTTDEDEIRPGQTATQSNLFNSLILTFNQIRSFQTASIAADCTQFEPSIKLLKLDHNQLPLIQAETFKCFRALERLHLRANRIRSIDELSLKHLSKLELLDLAANQLASLPSGLLVTLHNLRHLDMSENRLINFAFLNCAPAAPIAASATFSAASNSIEAEKGAPIGEQQCSVAISASLEFISLAGNRELNLDSGDLIGYISRSSALKQIQVSDVGQIGAKHRNQSQLASINNGQNQLDLRPSVYLETLKLSLVGHFDASFMSHLWEPWLSIDKIDFSCRTNVGPSNESNPQRAAIGTASAPIGCPFHGTQPLMGLKQIRLPAELQLLNLAGAQLDDQQLMLLLLNNNLTSDSQLSSLILSWNRLQHWPLQGQTAAKLASLKHLDLGGNKMRHFIELETEPRAFQLGQLQYLNLSFNALESLVEVRGASSVDEAPAPSLASLMPALQTLDLSHNQLTWIPSSLFQGLARLSWLRLDHNRLESFGPNLMVSRLLELSHNRPLRLITSQESLNSPSNENKGGKLSIDEQTYTFDWLLDQLYRDLIVSFHSHYAGWQSLQCLSVDEYISRDAVLNSYIIMNSGAQIPRVSMESELASAGDVQSLDWVPSNRVNGQLGAHASLDRIRSEREDESESENGEGRASEDRCLQLMGSLQSVRLDSTSGHINLNSIEVNEAKALHLSLRQNGLHQLQSAPNSSAQFKLVLLELAWNKMAQLPVHLCKDHLSQLRSLDLSYNQLTDFTEGFLHSCNKLAFLDVSHNAISSWSRHDPLPETDSSSILALKLNHNQIRWLSARQLLSLTTLRYVDLRNNPLALPVIDRLWSSSLPFRLQTDRMDTRLPLLSQAYELRPRIELNSSNHSIQVHWSGSTHERAHMMSLSQVIADGGTGSGQKAASGRLRLLKIQPASHSHVIRMCSLANDTMTQVCFALSTKTNKRTDEAERPTKREDDKESEMAMMMKEEDEDDKCCCFHVRRPSRVASCVSDLLHLSNGSSSTIGNALSSSRPRSQSWPVKIGLTDGRLADSTAEQANGSLQGPQDGPSAASSDLVLSFIDQLKNAWLQLKRLNLSEQLTNLWTSLSNQIETSWFGQGMATKQPIHSVLIIKLFIVGGAIALVALLIAVFTMLTYLSKAPDQPQGASSSPSNSDGRRYENLNNKCSTSPSDSCTSQSQVQLSSLTTSSSQNKDSLIVCTKSSQSDHSNQSNHSNSQHRQEIQELRVPVDDVNCRMSGVQASNCISPTYSPAPSSVETGETLQAVDSIHSALGPIQQLVPLDEYLNEHNWFAQQQQASQQAGYQQAPVATVMRMIKSNSANNFGLDRQNFGSHHGRASHANSTLRSRLHTLQERRQPMGQLIHPASNQYGTSDQQDQSTLSLLSISTALSGGHYSSFSSHSAAPQLANQACPFHRASLLEVTNEEQMSNGMVGLPQPLPPSRALEALQNQSTYFMG